MSKSHLGNEKTPSKAVAPPAKDHKEASMPSISPPPFAVHATAGKEQKSSSPVSQQKTASNGSNIVIKGSVGKGGDNKYDDVMAVQNALKRVGYTIAADGDFGDKTQTAINSFQTTALGFSDGKIDPGGRTLAKLNATANGAMATKTSPAAPTTTTPATPPATTKPTTAAPVVAAPVVAAPTMINFNWGSNANQGAVSTYARGVISDMVIASGGNSCTINSTARTPEDQARAMYNNLAAGKEISYAAPGAAVTAVFYSSKKAGKNATQIKADMTAEIYRQGPSKVSRHCADFNTLCVVDIDTGSIANGKKFVTTVDGESRVSKFLHPGNSQDPAYHIEIPIR